MMPVDVAAAVLLLLQVTGGVSGAEKAGPGPHTLIISDGKGMTRMDYKTGPACQKARDEVRRQVAPPANTPSVIYGRPSVKAFCVPR